MELISLIRLAEKFATAMQSQKHLRLVNWLVMQEMFGFLSRHQKTIHGEQCQTME